ncbi:MAG: class I SAM-dependent methyltransferase [Pseudomonadota bacterium]
MAVDLNDADFWSGCAAYREVAHDFTAQYSRDAWALADLPKGAKVLDIAAGSGALALTAARAGAHVLATDFSDGMVDAIRAHKLPNLEARVMDGQALDLPDASFDAAFSMFGIMLFADWRKGLAEMARVVRPGGKATLGTWRPVSGAAVNLLLAERVARLFPDIVDPEPIEGMNVLRDPDRLRAEMEAVGLGAVSIVEAVHDFRLEQAAIEDPDHLFQFSAIWPLLDADRKDRVLTSIRDSLAASDGVLAIPSPAWIATARRS